MAWLDSTGDGYQMIVAWNSLMISGLARAYGVFRQELYLELAARGALF